MSRKENLERTTVPEEKLQKKGDVSSKNDYINNAQVGTIIAFKVNNQKALSGMIEEISGAGFLVRTRKGVKFLVKRNNIMWVKTGSRWPKGVYLALKGEQVEDREIN